MQNLAECRTIDYFIRGYNSVHSPETISRASDLKQDAPDAICLASDGSKIALEHTSVYAPRRISKHQPRRDDLTPVRGTLERKLLCHYNIGVDQVWLLMHIRRTLPREMVEKALEGVKVPSRFNRVFLQWAVPINGWASGTGVLELPTGDFWLPRPHAA